MSDLGWRAEGIARARAAGGVELEAYRRPGFVSGVGVRRASDGVHAQGFDQWGDDEPFAWADPFVRADRLPPRA